MFIATLIATNSLLLDVNSKKSYLNIYTCYCVIIVIVLRTKIYFSTAGRSLKHTHVILLKMQFL